MSGISKIRLLAVSRAKSHLAARLCPDPHPLGELKLHSSRQNFETHKDKGEERRGAEGNELDMEREGPKRMMEKMEK